MRRVLALLLLISPAQASADGAVTPMIAAKSRVASVLAYSDQARVYREATVKLASGELELELARLPRLCRTDTVRVESKTATVVRTQLIAGHGQALPRQGAAKKLLADIEALLDRDRDLAAEGQVLAAELNFLGTLELSGPSEDGDSGRRSRLAPGIFAATWEKVFTWLDGRTASINARQTLLTEQRLALQKELHKLAVASQELDLGSVGQHVTRVVGTLKGSPGLHKVTISYLVPTVRWVPSYDLRYDPASRKVEAVYYALVNQASGEDWSKARLRFSTDMPTRLMAIPELPAWTLGRKRDFHPKPNRQVEPQPPVWRPGPRPVIHDPVMGWVQQALGQAGQGGHRSLEGKDGRLGDLLDGAMIGSAPRPSYGSKMRPREPMSRPMPTTPAPAEADMDYADSAPPPAPPVSEPVMAESVSYRQMSKKSSGGGAGVMGFASRSRGPSDESVPWSDSGYIPPSIHPDLPAAASGGYRFTLYAPGTHTVPSTGEARRVPLLSRTFPVEPVYRITPGRSPWAYLMATVKNGTGRPILRGRAHLFAGAMFRGKSWLNTALPGKTVDLPLGVDDAIKVSRHMTQRTVSKGVVFKDDVSEYTITVEIANNHAYPISVELHDQVPLKQGEKVEVKGVTSSPDMGKPDDQGRLRWKGAVPAREVKKVKFSFRIVRPRDWELRQHNG